MKYTLVTAVEGCIRASQHVAASEGWEPPATNACLDSLGDLTGFAEQVLIWLDHQGETAR